MRTPRVKTLIWVGIAIGLVAGMTLAVTFDPGDASKLSDGVTLKAPNDNVAVTVYGTTNVTLDDAFPNSSTHGSQFADRSVMINSSDGNITIASDSATEASVHTSNVTGTWTNVTEITAGGNTVEIYPENKQRVDVQGDVDNVSISNMSTDDGNVDFVMGGSNGGTGTITVYDLPANQRIVAVDGNGNYLDHDTTDNNGNYTVDIPLSTKTVSLKNNSNTEEAKHLNPDPANNSQVTSQPSELSVDVNDSDFAQGDDVEVNISLDDTRIHTENITSNQTVTTSNFSNLDIGDHTWWVNSTDAYGNTNNTKFTFATPQTLTLRNESNASQIITNKNITVTFFSTNGELVVERSDSDQDGNISLSGLPDTDFVVAFSGGGWYDRRVYIESIFNQQDVYLLNSTAFPTADDSAIETTFVYEDRTGKFPQDDTSLKIQRALDKNNNDTSEWTNVAGDFWGAAGEFPFTGEHQERYRLVIKNQETGDQRVLGTHIPTDDGVKNIIVGDIIFDEGNATGLYYDAGINPNATNLQAYYNDPTNSTSDLRVKIYEQGNKSNEIYDQNFSDLGEKAITVTLTDAQVEKNWIVEFDGTNNDGNVYGQVIVGTARYPINMDPALLSAFAYTLITFVMALYGPRVSIMGAWAGVFMFLGFMFIGWLSWSIPAVTIAVVAASGATFYREAVP